MFKILGDNFDYTVTKHHTLVLKYNNISIDQYFGKLRDTFGMNRSADIIRELFEGTVSVTVDEYLSLPESLRKSLQGYRVLDDGTHKTYDFELVPSMEYEYYGWETDGNHRFLLGDRTVTHNCNNQQYLTDRHFYNPLKEWHNMVVVDQVKVYPIKDFEFLFWNKYFKKYYWKRL